jgi:hypothetical protein
MIPRDSEQTGRCMIVSFCSDVGEILKVSCTVDIKGILKWQFFSFCRQN